MNQNYSLSAVPTDDECAALDKQNKLPNEPPDTGKAGGCPYDDNFCNGTPILIALRGDQYELTDLRHGARFDIDADGRLDRMSWTAPDGEVAFLALDRNGNGTIDNGAELFGAFTPMKSGGTAPNGFQALAEFDANGDGHSTSRTQFGDIWFSGSTGIMTALVSRKN